MLLGRLVLRAGQLLQVQSVWSMGLGGEGAKPRSIFPAEPVPQGGAHSEGLWCVRAHITILDVYCTVAEHVLAWDCPVMLCDFMLCFVLYCFLLSGLS